MMVKEKIKKLGWEITEQPLDGIKVFAKKEKNSITIFDDLTAIVVGCIPIYELELILKIYK